MSCTMATVSQQQFTHAGGPYSDTLNHGSLSTTETMVAEPEAPPPERPARRRTTPRHPISSMQEAFAESLEEATKGGAELKPKLRSKDGKSRREALLDQAKDDGPPDEIWRFRPGQECHELRRLVAQISFGVYLLLEGMANNKVDVITILQAHIDEVDEFLETTLEDIALATRDLQDRLTHLRLPMENMDIFEKLLEDRNFRLQIVTGNEIIEHIVARTTTALFQTEEDVTEGLRSTQDFTLYLAEQQHTRWRRERPDVEPIYEAMKGNADGWFNAFLELQVKGNALNTLIFKLNEVINEMERRAGEVSRRTRFSIQPFTAPAHSPRSSQSSSTTVTPTDSPKVPDCPPRLSLRLSSIIKPRTSVSSYFDLPIKRDVTSPIPTREIRLEQPAIGEAARGEPVPEDDTIEEEEEEEPVILEAKAYRSPHLQSGHFSPQFQDYQDRPRAETPETPSAVPQSEQPTADTTWQEGEREREDEAEAPLFLLQPRTYTPQLPSPLPSPRVQEPPAQPSRKPPSPKAVQIHTGAELERESQPKQRTSLRQRVSLRTTPPQSILVPPPRSRERQRPPQSSPRAYHSPDSAYYASDMERPPVDSFISMDPIVLEEFPPPPEFRRPALLPSPHSDQQFFRPVQASPHSPLQQRPHTSHTTVTPRHPTYQQQHQRNVPSRMGMSMMTAATNETGQTLKKKRSAFGWLKKAFSLDEEERAAFEQKRRDQAPPPNPYHDARSPRFLDGKRIR